jgi:hypothetical protein
MLNTHAETVISDDEGADPLSRAMASDGGVYR